jgi:hypothetical protein
MPRPAYCARLNSHVYVVRSLALICALALAPGNAIAWASPPPQQPAAAAAAAPRIPNEQLDSLVAPIALYPDPLLSQALVASTYPLEIVQLQQWLAKNKDLKGKALTDAALKQPWDPSIQAMVVLPDVLNRLANDIQWTTDLGNAFLAQQSDVMDAVQRMRAKAQGTGALASNQQQKVETRVIENKTVVIIEPSQPDVVYVPSYNPVVVYGPPIYPYPPIYYPYYPPYAAGAIVATSMVSFGVGVAVGAAWGGGWGWGCGWGNNDIDINVNNNFVRNNNIRNNNISGNRVGNNTWRHDASHRGGAPYSNRATADRFGGTARGDSLASRRSSRQTSARQPVGTSGRTTPGATRSAGSTRSAGGDQIGSRSVPRSSGGGNSAFSGSSSGGNRARATSSRGAMSSGRARSGGGGGRRR